MIKNQNIKDKIKTKLGELWWYSAILFIAQRLGDLINIYIGLWLVPQYVPMEQLGALLPLTQIIGLLGFPLAILLTPCTKFINTFSAKGEYGKVKSMLIDVCILLSLSSVLVGAYTWYSAPFFFARLRIDSTLLIWILTGITVTSLFTPIVNGVLSGLKKFRLMSVVGFFSTPVRMLVLFVLLPINGLLGYFSSQLALNVFFCVVSLWGIRHLVSRSVARESYYSHWREMISYTGPFVIITGVSTLSTTVQYLVIRQRLPEVESAAFYFCSRFSEIPNMLWASIGCIFFPLISDAHEKGEKTNNTLTNVLTLLFVGGGFIALLLGLTIPWVFGKISQCSLYQPYAYLVGWLAFANVFRVGFACFSLHEMACRRFSFLWYALPIALLESAFLVSFTGYGFFVPYLPMPWVEWMASLKVARLSYIVGVFFVTAMLPFALALLHLAVQRSKANKYSLDESSTKSMPQRATYII
jgi:O-antigen/teichoic acid export membrane protein